MSIQDGCVYLWSGGGGVGSFGVEDAGDEEVDGDEGEGVGAQEEGYGGPADGVSPWKSPPRR